VSDWVVEGDIVVGTSPILLPHICVECGRPSAGGVRYESDLFWYPGWIWIGILCGIIPAWLLYKASRRAVYVEYSLCADHVLSLRRRKLAGAVLMVAFAAVLAAAIAARSVPLGPVAGLLFIAGIVAYMAARPPLRAVDQYERMFVLRGFGREFLEGAARMVPAKRRD
jgi:hypothetical protein